MTVKRRVLTPLSASNTTPEVAAKYYEHIKTWALFRAYNKKDSQTFDKDAAVKYFTLFESMVGPQSSANKERIAKEEPEGLRMGICR